MDAEAPDLVTELVSAVDEFPTVVNVDLDSATVQALINDLAIGMNKNPVIAARYGLSMRQLYEFVSIPEARRRIKAKKAIWESDANLPERIKLLYGAITLEAGAVADRMLHDPTTPAPVKVKLFEVAGRFGGADVRSTTGGMGIDGPTGPQFNVQFVFSGTGKTEHINLVANPVIPIDNEGNSMP